MIRNIIISILLLVCIPELHAQNLTGTWEGILNNDERLRVYITMKKKELCGYTSDYVIRRPSSYCKANFRGWYDEEDQTWILVGTSFIDNSGDHILMVLRLWHEDGDPDNVLRGTEEPKSRSSSFLNLRSPLRIRKISSELPEDMPNCFPKAIKPPAPQKQKEATVKPLIKSEEKVAPAPPPAPKQPQPIVKPKPAIKEKPVSAPPKKPAPVLKPDTPKISSKIITTNAPVIADPELTKRMLERKKTEFSHLVVNEKDVTLSVYDNGIVDNDSVSIFYNGKLIVGKKKLSEKAIVIHLELDEKVSLHEIVMFAENLGSIPPNTALVVVTAGNKRYELHSSASLTENAVLTFEYIPK